LRPGERACLRRSLNLVIRKLATWLDVVFGDVLAHTTDLSVLSDEPVLAGGWFRLIELKKKES
jgi:phosphatidylethanolamine/phosphatidyl-N-methylethanolamine N-methyltransferase